jgi:hypothetical protein
LGLLFTATGVAIPWATGLGVKLYLDSMGRPTLPVSDFLDPAALVFLLVATVFLWSFPFILLAAAAVVPWRPGFGIEARHQNAMLPVWLAYAGGTLTAVPVFAAIFWEFDIMMLFVPVGVSLMPGMVGGYLLGCWIARRRG